MICGEIRDFRAGCGPAGGSGGLPVEAEGIVDGAGGILESRAGKALLGRAGQAVTTRNWATVYKLQALAIVST